MNREFARNYVYVLYRLTGEPFYVGVGAITQRMKLGFRIRQHFAEARAYAKGELRAGGNEHKLNIINECLDLGYEPLYEIVATDVSRQDANKLEKELIAYFGRADLGVGPLTNRNDGGAGSSAPSDETRAKISKGSKGKIVSQETRKRQSMARKGRIITPEWRENISKGSKGKPHSPEHNAKVAAKNRERCQTDENRKRQSLLSSSYWRIVFPDGHEEFRKGLVGLMSEYSELKMSGLSQSGRKGKPYKEFLAYKLDGKKEP